MKADAPGSCSAWAGRGIGVEDAVKSVLRRRRPLSAMTFAQTPLCGASFGGSAKAASMRRQ